jgi:hypothetical protein
MLISFAVVSTLLIVTCTNRFLPSSPPPFIVAPKPTRTTSCPALRMSVSHPIRTGVIGTLVTGVFRVQNEISVPEGCPTVPV